MCLIYLRCSIYTPAESLWKCQSFNSTPKIPILWYPWCWIEVDEKLFEWEKTVCSVWRAELWSFRDRIWCARRIYFRIISISFAYQWLSYGCKKCRVLICADDTVICTASQSITEIRSAMTNGMGNISKWLDHNRCAMNLRKGKLRPCCIEKIIFAWT